MGLALPQLAPASEDRVSGAQVIDGSLKFESGFQTYLKRTNSSSGNRKTWTLSVWMKRNLSNATFYQSFFINRTSASYNIRFNRNTSTENNTNFGLGGGALTGSRKFRDTGWFHAVLVYDTTNATEADRIKWYINGQREANFSATTYPSQNTDGEFNRNQEYGIGYYNTNTAWDGSMSQYYFIDGVALGPESFGFTDPLTNTWRPKKFEYFSTPISTQYSGASTLTWDDSPIGNIYTLSNGNKTATAGGGGSGYSNADAWSIAIPANSTYAWTLDITNGDTTGGWYFTDSQTDSNTHADQRGNNSLGMRPGTTHAGYYGTFASANGGSDGQTKISMPSASAGPGFARVDFVVYRPASGTGKVWVKGNGESSWVGGGDPSNTSSTASFIIPDGTTYFGITLYDRTNNQIATFDGDGSIQQKIGGNSFYLPFDGNSPIGEDKSGVGNNWTPVNFGGSVALPKATGAKPILNTDGGGNVARSGVFGSELNQTIAVTVSNASGNNKYYLDGSLTPNLAFTRGSTITFNTGDSSGNGHPFKLSSTNASGSGGSEYTDGVAYYINGSVVSGSDYVSNYSSGAASGFRGIKWTVPHNQSTTYYYCTIHTGMGNNGAFTSTIDETKADPYAWKNVLALPLIDNGAGGTTQDFSNQINAGSTTKASTTTGNTNSTSAQSVFYSKSFILDGNGDDIRVPDTADFTFGSGDFTIEGWAHQTANSSWRSFVMKYTTDNASSSWFYGFLNGTQYFYFYHGASAGVFFASSDGTVSGTVKPIPLNTWVHCAVTRSGNVFRMFENGAQVCTMTVNETNNDSSARLSIGQDADGNYDFAGYFSDVRVYKGVAKYTSNFIPASTNPDILPDTPSGVSGGSKLAKVTDGAVSLDGSGDYLSLADSADFNLAGNDFTIEAFVYHSSTNFGSYEGIIAQWVDSSGSDRAFALETVGAGASSDLEFYYFDTSNNFVGPVQGAALQKERWHHVAVCRSGSSIRIFIDGVGGTASSISVNIKNSTNNMTIGGNVSGAAGYWPGFISNVRFINGTALYTSNFTPPSAPLTNVTNTKLLCCQSNTSAIEGAVKPGTITAAGNAVATNFNPFTTDINAVRGQETGYCTFNVLRERSGGYNPTFKEGNLFMDGRGDGTGTLSAQSGKFYFEVLVDTVGSSGQIFLGVQDAAYVAAERGWSTAQIAAMRDTNTLYGNGATGSGVTYGAGDLMSFAFDADNNKLYIAKNGVYLNSGVPSQGTGFTHSGINFAGGYTPIVSDGQTGQKFRANFGQKPFKYAPPAGFQPLNAANVRPETVIARSDQYVRATIYTGSNGTNHKITSGIDADLVWIKNRSSAFDSVLYDTIRISDGSGGDVAGSSRSLSSNRNLAQGGLGTVSLLSDGFNLHYATSNFNASNNYVAWSWRAGGSKNTFNKDDVGYASAAAAGLDGGSLAVTGASVGTKQGFSIIKFASGSSGNKTLSHGLLETPTFILVKTTGASSDWSVYHKDLGGTVNNYLVLNSDAANATASNIWGAAVPTSSVFGINPGTTCATNQDVIAYLWHDVPGLQKFGKYDGNNNANGPFIELGFRPTLFAMKQLTGTGYWMVYDSARDPINNGSPYYLFWNADSAQGTGYDLDFLSNGVKLRTNNANFNSSTPYVYMAWAEAPVSGLYGAQSNAR